MSEVREGERVRINRELEEVAESLRKMERRRKIKQILSLLAVMTIVALTTFLATMLYAYHITYTNLCEAYCGKLAKKALIPRPFTCKCVEILRVRV